MIPFQYSLAGNLEGASRLIDHQESMALAGGTTLIDLMKLNVLTPKQVVYLKPHLDVQVREEDGQLIIGAGCTMARLAESPLVRDRFPAVRQSLITAASPQIRNMATIGGNLLQRTRSPYFRHPDMPSDGVVAGAKESPFGSGAECSTLAILGNGGKLVGTYPGDFAIALLAFDGKVHLQGTKGQRVVPARDFYQLPSATPEYSTKLEANELITAVSIPLGPATHQSIYLKIRERSSYAFALASAALGLELDGAGTTARIRRACKGIGGLGSIPWNSPEAVKVLEGNLASDEIFIACAEAALADAKPPEGVEYKVTLAKRTIVRALRILRDQGPLTDSQLWAMQHGRQ
jgi:xanthine dehydrogenase YagS FAD-binding subunit